MTSYTSDLTENQFSKIRSDLEKVTKNTRPRKTDIRDIFNAVLYLLKNATKWRDIPKDYPNWKLVYYHFSRWKQAIDPDTGEPVLEVALKKIGAR
jgi:transposase